MPVCLPDTEADVVSAPCKTPESVLADPNAWGSFKRGDQKMHVVETTTTTGAAGTWQIQWEISQFPWAFHWEHMYEHYHTL